MATKYAGPRTQGSVGPTCLKHEHEFQDGSNRGWSHTRLGTLGDRSGCLCRELNSVPIATSTTGRAPTMDLGDSSCPEPLMVRWVWELGTGSDRKHSLHMLDGGSHTPALDQQEDIREEMLRDPNPHRSQTYQGVPSSVKSDLGLWCRGQLW